MSTTKKTITCILYTSLVQDTRIRDTIAAIEATLPTEPLCFGFGSTPRLKRVADPAARLMAHIMADDIDTIYNGDWDDKVSLFVNPKPPHAVLDNQPVVQMNIDFPDTPEFAPRLPDLVRTVCPAARALWAIASPSGTLGRIIDDAGRINPSPRGIVARGYQVFPAAMPGFLDWLNYWSLETCTLLDFTPDDPRARVFAAITPVDGHGLILTLTDEPLDLDRPAHLDALTAAYRAFPEIDRARVP